MTEDTDCYVYMIGHEHATFGHAIKVGISRSPGARLATLQTGCIDELKLMFSLRFATRELALEVERLFHESELAGPVRGEWVGCEPVEALFYLTSIAVEVLRRRYGGSDLALVRKYAQLPEAFEITDQATGEQQSEWLSRIDDWNVLRGAH